MQTALASAYNYSPRLQAERARVREIDENYVQAQALGRSTLTAEGSLSRTTSSADILGAGGVTSLSGSLTPRTAQLVLIQPLYQGGRVRGLKSQAKAGILAARESLKNTEQNVLLAAATAYLDVLRDEEVARIRRNNVKVLTRQRIAAQDRFDVGAGTRTDTAQADSRLAVAEIGLSQADAALAVSRAAFVRYMGSPPSGLMQPTQFILPTTLILSQAQARKSNPQLSASRHNESVAQAGIYVAQSAHKPNISLNASLQNGNDTSFDIARSQAASITAQIRIPILSGGTNRSRVRAAKQAQTRAKFETREIEYVIDEAIAGLWAQLNASKSVLQSSKKQVLSAEIAFEGVELEQQVGTRNTLDVLDAEQELLNAKLSVVLAERNVNLATYQLLTTMGRIRCLFFTAAC